MRRASVGGTVPLQAPPGFLKLISEIEPLRQILGGVRAILYFDAAGDTGLTRGTARAAAGLLFWLALGAPVVRSYDHKGPGPAALGPARLHPPSRRRLPSRNATRRPRAGQAEEFRQVRHEETSFRLSPTQAVGSRSYDSCEDDSPRPV